MPRARRAILFRVLILIPMIMLGKEIFYIAQGMRANHWLAIDAKPVSAIVTQAHKKSVYAYRYVADGKEYLGHSARDWEDEKLQKLAVGEQTSVVISASHPWISSFKVRETSWLAYPIVVVMILFEGICLAVLINPRSLSFLNVKQQPPNEPPNEAIQRFIHLVLLQAQKDGATEMVVGIASPSGVTIRYKVEDTWHEMPPFSAHIRADVVSELVRMAGFPGGQIPREGVLDESLGHIRLQWTVAIPSADGECMLKRIDD